MIDLSKWPYTLKEVAEDPEYYAIRGGSREQDGNPRQVWLRDDDPNARIQIGWLRTNFMGCPFYVTDRACSWHEAETQDEAITWLIEQSLATLVPGVRLGKRATLTDLKRLSHFSGARWFESTPKRRVTVHGIYIGGRDGWYVLLSIYSKAHNGTCQAIFLIDREGQEHVVRTYTWAVNHMEEARRYVRLLAHYSRKYGRA